MTSAGTSTPGRSFAARVARVTPSLIRRCPSLPRMSCKGGIPSSEFPCLAICRASLPGSAPCARLGGRCRLPGSTSMNSGILLRVALAASNLTVTPLNCTADSRRAMRRSRSPLSVTLCASAEWRSYPSWTTAERRKCRFGQGRCTALSTGFWPRSACRPRSVGKRASISRNSCVWCPRNSRWCVCRSVLRETHGGLDHREFVFSANKAYLSDHASRWYDRGNRSLSVQVDRPFVVLTLEFGDRFFC